MSDDILILGGDDYEDLELHYPRLRLREAGFTPVVAGAKAGDKCRSKHGYPAQCEVAFADVDAKRFLGIVVPGGWLPDKLRRDPHVLKLVQAFDQQRRLVASICHGGWVCVSANVVRGRRYTGSPGIKDDLVNAGASFEDRAVVVDGHHVSSRKPDDLPEFMAAALAVLGSPTR